MCCLLKLVCAGFAIATHGIVLENGLVRLDGPPQDLLTNPEVNHLYLGGTLSTK